METVSQRDKNLFENLFVLEAANNHNGNMEKGLKIIQDHGQVCRQNNIKAAIKLQFRHMDSFVHPDFKGSERTDQKALNYINKAINIDSENVVYWKLYAQINLRLNFLEEAERGFKKTLDLGNYELQTWLSRADVLITLGEYEASILNLIQASEFYPDTAEIEFRLAGLNFTLHEHNKGHYHLKNGMLLNQEFNYIIEELFPNVMQKPSVKQIFLGAKK